MKHFVAIFGVLGLVACGSPDGGGDVQRSGGSGGSLGGMGGDVTVPGDSSGGADVIGSSSGAGSGGTSNTGSGGSTMTDVKYDSLEACVKAEVPECYSVDDYWHLYEPNLRWKELDKLDDQYGYIYSGRKLTSGDVLLATEDCQTKIVDVGCSPGCEFNGKWEGINYFTNFESFGAPCSISENPEFIQEYVEDSFCELTFGATAPNGDYSKWSGGQTLDAWTATTYNQVVNYYSEKFYGDPVKTFEGVQGACSYLPFAADNGIDLLRTY